MHRCIATQSNNCTKIIIKIYYYYYFNCMDGRRRRRNEQHQQHKQHHNDSGKTCIKRMAANSSQQQLAKRNNKKMRTASLLFWIYRLCTSQPVQPWIVLFFIYVCLGADANGSVFCLFSKRGNAQSHFYSFHFFHNFFCSLVVLLCRLTCW